MSSNKFGFILEDASKSQKKLRILNSAPSGGGKTLSSLLLAYGIVGDWSKIAVIDTERKSSSLYSDNKKHNIGKFKIINLTSPYSVERYNAAIKFAEDSGIEVVIVDSIAHEWQWCLEYHGGNDRFVDDVMGWTGSSDMKRAQVKLHFNTKEEAIEKIDELVKKDDVVLVKASRGMELEKIVEYLNK